eukprot:GGOE01005996.1.p1 GENE.GGOE01005996.1~~GGOE01005996.1.p1  ORF type:complete len:350 (-),score=96.38 GGOE01005996.1:130-1092(-)
MAAAAVDRGDASASNAQTVFEAVLDMSLHERMRSDQVRCDAFETAIRRRVRGMVVLDIGTGPFALLALKCAEAGARVVYAVEVVPAWAEKARQAVAAAGYSNTVVVYEGYSTELVLPERVDVVVHEILGNIASEEGAALSLSDAQHRFVKQPPPPNFSIPHRARTWIAPTAFPVVYEDDVQLPAQRRTYRLDEFPEDLLLAAAQVWEDLQFTQPLPLTSSQTLQFRCSRSGPLCGLVNYITVDFDKEGATCINTLRQRTTWRVVVALFGQSVHMECGDTVAVRCMADIHVFPSRYRFDVTLHPDTPHERFFDGRSVELKM